MRFVLPLVAFIVMALFLALGLNHDPRAVPSAIIDKPAPPIDLPALNPQGTPLDMNALRGQVWMLNVWASWCAPCREELPLLKTISAQHKVPVYGLNYKDKSDEALAWLARFGDPYITSVSDSDGRIGIEYGVYGVPETFIIDGAGRIRYKQLGLITPEIWRTKMLPVIEALR